MDETTPIAPGRAPPLSSLWRLPSPAALIVALALAAAGWVFLVAPPAVASAGAGKWTYPRDVSCSGAGHCVVVGQWDTASGLGGPLAATTADAGSHWATQHLPLWLDALFGVSCPSERFCAAVGDGVVTTTNGGRTWAAHHTPLASPGLLAVSCPNTKNCMAVGYDNLATTTDGGTTWDYRVLPNQDLPCSGCEERLVAVSCPVANVCTVVANLVDGSALLRTTDDGAEWATDRIPHGAYPDDVSCMTTKVCVAVGLTYSPTEMPLGAAMGVRRVVHPPDWRLHSGRQWCGLHDGLGPGLAPRRDTARRPVRYRCVLCDRSLLHGGRVQPPTPLGDRD
jgi:photosystem II stability/assembly factor-like uncharacterized protein